MKIIHWHSFIANSELLQAYWHLEKSVKLNEMLFALAVKDKIMLTSPNLIIIIITWQGHCICVYLCRQYSIA